MPDNIQDIKEMLIAKKNARFKDYLDKINAKTVIAPISLKEKEAAEKIELKIKTSTMIDKIVGGGIPEGKSAMLYGEFGSGKTQTCFTASCVCDGWVIYIDSESSFRCERLEAICKARGLNWEKVRDKIIYFNPTTWIEQMIIAESSLPSPADVKGKVDLIICDSISKLFRGLEFLGRETLTLKNGLLREFIFALEQTGKAHRAAVIYTTQVYDTPSAGGFMTSKADTQKPVGGHSAEHQPDFILFFKKSTGNLRIVRMVDSSYNELAEEAFVINEKGIDYLPEGAKAMKYVEENAEKFEEKQHQETIVKLEKKKKNKDGKCETCGLPIDICTCEEEAKEEAREKT